MSWTIILKKWVKNRPLRPINAVTLSWGMAAYFAFVLNFPLLAKVFVFFKGDQPLRLTSAIACLLFCLYLSIFSVFSLKYLEKPVYIVLTLLSSVLSYAYVYYGLSFNGRSPFLATLEQSNWEEISPLITPSFLIWFLFLGIMPSVLIFKLKLVHPFWRKEAAFKLLGVCAYPLFYATTALPVLPNYHLILCESGLAARLPFQMVPTNFMEDVFNHYKDRIFASFPYQTIGDDAKSYSRSLNGKKKLLVFVVGETARSMNFELNGYSRKTNRYTMQQDVVSFQKVSSCGTSTRVSVPCLFSSFPRKKFNGLFADHQDTLLDMLKRAGLNLFWIENNGAGGCQGVCRSVQSIVLHDFDAQVVRVLGRELSQLDDRDTMVVLHIHGSHGPDYYTMYPDEFRYYKPDCRQNDVRFCDKQALINAYDNSILYTDFVLNEVITLLKHQSSVWNTALIYTSDHGESLGEQGFYEHCSPYIMAPIEQTQVPLIVWASSAFERDQNISMACLKKKAQNGRYSHDNIFHSILGLMDIHTAVYRSDLDIFNSCRDKHKRKTG